MKKPTPEEMSDEQILDSYVNGSSWLIKKSQVTGTDKNTLGEKYNHKEFMVGLNRLEAIEREMQKRGLAY